LMREYLTGTTDHGTYRFSINDHPAFRKLISYGSLFTESARTGVIGRDASVADRMFIEDHRRSILLTGNGSCQGLSTV
ncbi:hypothetical protein, partial [Enterococcus lactis]|uniref:hypothetical protein n=1 Tax=Enterococcus lactis TaxID=357441 RepID=UPI0022E55C78